MSRYDVEDHEVDIERVRLDMLAETRDPHTFALLDRAGVTEGMEVMEVGAGNGSVSAWLARRVGARGRVASTDIDLQFHADMPDNVEVIRHDVVKDPLPGRFDLIHARAVIQHIPERVEVLGRLCEALRPGGALVVEDGAMLEFSEQTLPEPYLAIHRLVAGAVRDEWRDPHAGVRVLGWMRDLGLEGLEVIGDVWTMRPGEASGEWWFLALERAVPRLVEFGVISDADGKAALAQVRAPGFAMISPTSIATIGRKP